MFDIPHQVIAIHTFCLLFLLLRIGAYIFDSTIVGVWLSRLSSCSWVRTFLKNPPEDPSGASLVTDVGCQSSLLQSL